MLQEMVYLVTYDLNAPGKNYDNLWAALRRYDYVRDPGLDSVWFLSTTQTAGQISDVLRIHIDVNDCFFVTQLHRGTHQGWIKESVWTWINARL